MSKTKRGSDVKRARYERVILTLPPDVLAEAQRFASAFHQGNRSGFIAAAIRSYIEQLKKTRHTARLRDAYSAAASAGKKLAAEWDAAADDSWRQLDSKRL